MPKYNISWEFTTHVCSGHPDGSGSILRPMMPVQISHQKNSIDTLFLLDSGADFPMIPRDLAESIGVDIESLPRDVSSGIGGETEIGWIQIDVEFGQRKDIYRGRWWFQVNLIDYSNKFPLLGREPLFSEFDVNFRMAYADTRGKFVLSKVIRHRAPDRYKR